MDAYGVEPLPHARITSRKFHNAIPKIRLTCTVTLYSGSSSPGLLVQESFLTLFILHVDIASDGVLY